MKSPFIALAFAALSVQPNLLYAASRSATLEVPGMTCAACPVTVKKALSRVDGVSDVQVSFERKQAVVTFDDAKTSVGALTQATTNAGYPSAEVGAK